MTNILKKVTLLSAAVLGLSGIAFASQPTTVSASHAKTTAVKAAKAKAANASAKKAAQKAAAQAASYRAVAASNEAALAAGSNTNTTIAAAASSTSATVSVGSSQTTIDSTFNINGTNSATGGKRVQKTNGSLPLFNANVNWNNAVDTFNVDPTMKGNKNDVIPTATLAAALKKNGFDSVYMKVTPTIIPRISGGLLDNLFNSPTGIWFKFNLDNDSLPQNVHYGDNIRLAYNVDDSSYYVKALPSTKNAKSGANADGYTQFPIYRTWVKDIVDQYLL